MDISGDQKTSYDGKWGAMLSIGLGVFMGTLDTSIINVSLPTLVEQLDTTFAAVQWVVLGYVLVITATMLGAARLGDIFEKKGLYISGMIIFTLGSLLCGLSPNIHLLIAFRVLQGFGAVILQALGTAIIVEAFPPNERGRALGIIGSIISLGISLGPALGGLLIGLIGWRWIFLVKVPIGIVALIVGFRFLPKTPPRLINQSFDIFGAVALFLALGSFALGMTFGQDHGFGHQLVWKLLTISCAGMILFFIIEKKINHPMIDLSLFKNIQFSLNLIMGFIAFLILSGTFLMPFFLQMVKHYPPQQVGMLMMLTPALMGVIAPFSGIFSDRFGAQTISFIGLLIIAAGCLLISTLTRDSGIIGYLLRMAPLGIGFGFFQSPNNSAIMGSAPPERLGVASGLLALSRNLGQTAGMPLMGTYFTATVLSTTGFSVLSDIGSMPPQALVSGLTATYRLGGTCLLLSILIAVTGIRIMNKGRAK